MNITKPGARIDRPTIRELIAYATCRNHPISNSTLLRMEKDGRIPCRLNPLASPVWDTREVLEALGLQQ
ncbi:TPA: lactate dehydrogenase [Neisseria gonorrhoeae]|uniref:Putative phage associated protein n=1 Tax=Neisseria gonorrhoeae TaxID=485 RepID=A0A378VYB3_NEIGO|nr:lactate dehydrogenase [Neisseria gonorrhoeae]SUA24151.1 putative phage associated protein [Neisseria gonorrhoeae]